MTLRDWFAGQALASVMGTAENMGSVPEERRRAILKQVADMIYEMADAMLEARK